MMYGPILQVEDLRVAIFALCLSAKLRGETMDREIQNFSIHLVVEFWNLDISIQLQWCGTFSVL